MCAQLLHRLPLPRPLSRMDDLALHEEIDSVDVRAYASDALNGLDEAFENVPEFDERVDQPRPPIENRRSRSKSFSRGRSPRDNTDEQQSSASAVSNQQHAAGDQDAVRHARDQSR